MAWTSQEIKNLAEAWRAWREIAYRRYGYYLTSGPSHWPSLYTYDPFELLF